MVNVGLKLHGVVFVRFVDVRALVFCCMEPQLGSMRGGEWRAWVDVLETVQQCNARIECVGWVLGMVATGR